MSRTRKFRVWDKLNQVFIDPDKGYQGHYILTLDGRFQNLQNGSGGEEYIVQQYTGIKDRNGREIYEGDIVKAGNKNKDYIEYECEYSDEETAFILKYDDSFIYLPDFETLEIVGNALEQVKYQ